MKKTLLVPATLILCACSCLLGSATDPSPAPEAEANSSASAKDAKSSDSSSAGQQSGESRRNENVRIDLVDNNAAREVNMRVGATATVVNDFRANLNYFGAEYGVPQKPAVHASPDRSSAMHGAISWGHLNSIFTARSFFQAGAVKPARQNTLGQELTTSLWRGAHFSVSGFEDRNQGSVNGNILIPLPSERTPLTEDPVLRPIVQRFLDAYPAAQPNRTDIAARAFNTNSMQRISADSYAGRLDQEIGPRDRVLLRYSFSGQQIDAFQFVKGQNADTRTKSHSARITWNRLLEQGALDLSLGFDRQGALLTPDQESLTPIQVGSTITPLGPMANLPIDRAQNSFHSAGALQKNAGNHDWMFGFRATRFQYNGSESEWALPNFMFRDDAQHTAMENLRLGKPTLLAVTIGSDYRGFRNFDGMVYAGDRWKATRDLTVNATLRYEPWTKPVDVTGRSHLPFDSDLNNVSGSLGLAYRLPGKLGVARVAYAVAYGQIFPVTYGQDRLNAPYHVTVLVPNPNMADPYAGFAAIASNPNVRANRLALSPDLATPYSFQYNASWETEVKPGWRLQTGYVGSRTRKLFQLYFLNRAQYVDGIPFTSLTQNLRRPDSRYYDYMLLNNGSMAWYDAARVTLAAPAWRDMSFNVSYWFSKSIDLGGDYMTAGTGADSRLTLAQTEADSHHDLRALSNFDQPHALIAQFAYRTPRLARAGWMQKAFGGWTLSAIEMLKSGTPFNLDTGADAPGFGNNDGVMADRPMLLDPTILGRTIGDPDTSQSSMPRSAFRYINAPLETRGNLGRNVFRKGRIANMNASLSRTWLAHGASVTFRAESVNLFNTPQFAAPGLILTSPSFGQITNTLNDGRAFRFSLRLGI